MTTVPAGTRRFLDCRHNDHVERDAGRTFHARARRVCGLGVEDSGVHALIRAVYHLLGLHTFFTAGEKETRAWTIHAGEKAPAAAGAIHSDFERGFIAAETIHCNDLIAAGSFAKAREAGKLRLEGNEYEVRDGDVILFRFNV